MNSINVHAPANKWAERFQNGDCEDARQSVQGLTVDEADLLQPLPRAAYTPWIVPLTAQPNDAAGDAADD